MEFYKIKSKSIEFYDRNGNFNKKEKILRFVRYKVNLYLFTSHGSYYINTYELKMENIKYFEEKITNL